MKYTFTFFFLLSWFISSAQEAAPATGAEASGTGGTVSYSIGQVFYTTDSSLPGSVSKGVQQPYEIFLVSVKEEAKNLQLNVYPNPTNDVLQINSEYSATMLLRYQLFDISGKLIMEDSMDNTTTISMADYAASTYYLKVYDHGREIKTFKVIKNRSQE